MARISKERIFKDSKISLINTRQKRYNNVEFSSELINDNYVLTSTEGRLALDIKDEIILYVITKFRFCPSWLAKQWYDKDQFTNVMGGGSPSDKLRSFINFGLLYEFPSAVAVFLMPTDRLASLFGDNLGNFNNPPYNTLTHTISEEQVMFDCLTGKAEYLQGTNCVPYISQWGLGKANNSAFVVPESDYTVRNSYFKNHIQEFNDEEATLAEEMLAGTIITTSDFKESKLTIHKKIDQDNYFLKIPDLVVLAPRIVADDGVSMPMSVALEVELTGKGKNKYKEIIKAYWDNIKYGKVVYLTDNKKIRQDFINAYKEVEFEYSQEDKTCEFVIWEFEIPYNKEQLIQEVKESSIETDL